MRKLGKILFFGAIVNFMAFFVLSMSLGGDALNGRIDEGGDHLVSNHGRLTKVEPWVWHFNRAHAISVFITHPLGMLGGLLLTATGGLRDTERGGRRPATGQSG